jgi:hypothetical protein
MKNSNLDKFRNDLKKLILLGDTMELDLLIRSKDKLTKEQKEFKDKYGGSFERDYQRWYTESHAVIRQLIPDRLKEFEELYKGDGKRKQVDQVTYTIQDWLNGFRALPKQMFSEEKLFEDFGIVSMRFKNQMAILRTSETRLESSLFDIRQVVGICQ